MKLTIEISMYPFNEDYIPPIQGFIDKLNEQQRCQVKTFPTCTIVVGEYDEVMALLSATVKWSVGELGKAVFVSKMIPNFEAF